MTELARGYSYVMYLAKAGATYTIPFPYLHTDDVRVFAGDVGDAVEQTFNWIGPTEVSLAGTVTEGILVTIRRFTPRDAPLVLIQDGGQLPARELNLNTKQLLYVMQEQIDFGVGGSGLPGGGSGWPGNGQGSDLAIQQIIDQLMQSPVMGLLTSRLDDIDDNAETLLEQLIRSDQTFNERRRMDGRVALVETTLTQVQDDTHSLAQQTTELFAKYDDAAAQVISVQQALATETEARAAAVQQVSAGLDGALSQITTAQQSIANEAEARAQAITKVSSDYQAADSAVTSAINQTLQTTYATKSYAQSVAQTQVEAFANGQFVNLQERFEAMVDGTADPAGSWQANWTVRINAGAINGTPVIAGIGLGVDSKTGSNFVVMADRFAIVSPTYTTTDGVGQMKYPFVVGTVGGVSTVGITGQLIVDGSVTADKIKVNSLSALTANMGDVNGGTFRTYQLDANGAIIDPNEFRVELTNKPTDSWPIWVGSGVKNANNAVFYVDRSGNAHFDGTVSALNITDQLQAQVTGSWTGDIQASVGGVTSTITLPAPLRLGETHRPLIMAELDISITDNDGAEAADGKVYIERLVGSTWTVLRTQPIGGFKFTSMGSSMILFDSPTSAAVTYRIRVDGNGAAHPVDIHLVGTNTVIFGLR